MKAWEQWGLLSSAERKHWGEKLNSWSLQKYIMYPLRELLPCSTSSLLPSDDDCNGHLQLLMEKERIIQRIQLAQFIPSYTPSKSCLGLFCKGLVSPAQWQLFLSSSGFYMLHFYLTLLPVRSNQSLLLRGCFLKGAKEFILQATKETVKKS